jgi:hypothetical protein
VEHRQPDNLIVAKAQNDIVISQIFSMRRHLRMSI